MTRRAVAAVLLGSVAVLAVVAGLGVDGSDADDPGGEINFTERTAETGMSYQDVGTGVGNGNAGVYVTDVDNDGWEDLVVVGGERPALFVNDNGTFERSGALPALDRPFKSAAVVDYDGDGWEDLVFLPAGGRVVTLHNDRGTFERVDAGLGNTTYPLGAAPADYDGDGDQDLLVYQSGDWAEGKPKGSFSLNASFDDDNGNPNLLYENTGDGFERVTDAGIEGDRWSLAASFVDLTGDGRPDVHVANDYNTDIVYVNEGDGTFTRRELGGNTARNGMASELADVNGDGRMDVFVTNIHLPVSRQTMSPDRYERVKDFLTFVVHSNRTKGNTLLVNRGDGRFTDRAVRWNLRDGGWGWAATFADFDNDGDRDLLHATQNVVTIDPEDPFYTYPMLWERENGNFTQLDAAERGFAEDDGRGMVTVDYDRDGDRDVVMAVYGGEFSVYENTVNRSTTSLQVRVVDGDGATANGATVTVTGDGQQTTRRQRPRTDFLSRESRFVHVGLGETERVDLTVTWPDGTERTFEEIPADRRVRVGPDGVETVANFSSGPDG
jgi:hypothetical protein